ncbi:hypothetical protein [uncultured Bifidobacterium sp.]|uniref:hypothetical protein n=1 Tax=uncultured Bifidobacterium sp. TaxID=165187 RepID=UPI002628E921|nr:hypothetical protein [uncultured Bifidobacterium sp.]
MTPYTAMIAASKHVNDIFVNKMTVRGLSESAEAYIVSLAPDGLVPTGASSFTVGVSVAVDKHTGECIDLHPGDWKTFTRYMTGAKEIGIPKVG